MASPFGLAYGIGAGLANVPKAFYQGKADALAAGLKELEASEYRRKVEEQRSLEQALSQAPEAPEQFTYNTPGVTQEQFDEMASHNVPPGEEGPNPTYGQQVTQAKQLTPFQSPAGERASMLKRAAEMQRSRGFGLSASQLMQQAQTADKEHQAASALELIRASKFGDSDRMMSAIHALGGVNIRNVQPNGDGGVIVTSGDGHDIEMDESDLRAIATGSDPMDVFRQKAAITQENKLEQMDKKAEMDQLLLQQRIQGNMEKLQKSFENEKELLPIKERIRQATGKAADSAMMKNIRFLAETRMNKMAEQGIEISPAQAMSDAADTVVGANRGRVTEADIYKAAITDRRALKRDNPHADKPGNKDYSTWKALTDKIMSLTRPRTQATPSAPRVGYVEPQAQPASSGFKYLVKTDGTGTVIQSNDPDVKVGSRPKMKKGGKSTAWQEYTYNK